MSFEWLAHRAEREAYESGSRGNWQPERRTRICTVSNDEAGVGVPERRIGCEALEASAKLRKSSIDCLSAASFGAARSEQLRLLAEKPLERREASSSWMGLE